MVPGESGIIAAVNALRPFRRIVALVATFAVVAAQSAAAAVACASHADAIVAAASVAALCPEHLGGAAPATQERSANLCEVHCQGAPVPAAGFPALAPAPIAAITVPAAVVIAQGCAPAAPEAKGTPPPARSLYCRLQL